MTSRLDNAAARAVGCGRLESHGMLVLELARDDLFHVVRRLKDEFAFDLLLDVTAVDWPLRTPRFEVVYHFYSTQHRDRVRIKTVSSSRSPWLTR